MNNQTVIPQYMAPKGSPNARALAAGAARTAEELERTRKAQESDLELPQDRAEAGKERTFRDLRLLFDPVAVPNALAALRARQPVRTRKAFKPDPAPTTNSPPPPPAQSGPKQPAMVYDANGVPSGLTDPANIVPIGSYGQLTGSLPKNARLAYDSGGKVVGIVDSTKVKPVSQDVPAAIQKARWAGQARVVGGDVMAAVRKAQTAVQPGRGRVEITVDPHLFVPRLVDPAEVEALRRFRAAQASRQR